MGDGPPDQDPVESLITMLSMLGCGLMAAGIKSEVWRSRAALAGYVLVVVTSIVLVMMKIRRRR